MVLILIKRAIVLSKGVKLDANSNVESWENTVNQSDKSEQTDATKRPQKITSDPLINNQPSIYFDGVSDVLINENAHTFGAMFVFVNWTGQQDAFPKYSGILSQYKYQFFDS